MNSSTINIVMDRLPPSSQFSDPLREVVLSWALSNKLRLLLAMPPFRAPEGVEIVPRRTPLLRATRFKQSALSAVRTAHWPRQAVNAAHHVCMICVLEGEADMRIGVTERMAIAAPEIDRDIGGYTLRLPARSLLVIPPGVPYSDGSRGHWERPQPDAAFSRLFWMLFQPQSVSTHLCLTDGAHHSSGASQTILDSGLNPFIEALLGELSTPAPHSLEIAQHLSAALLLRLVQSRSTHAAEEIAPETETYSPVPAEAWLPSLPDHGTGDKAVERACRYILHNLNAPLSIERIAAGAYVSPPHLNRLFRMELHTSVMAYVAATRIEAAKNLLCETDLSIHAISNLIGYSHPNYFSQVFCRATGLAPRHFRRRHALSQPQKHGMRKT
jgi:AraC-like DNA-binding protein